MFLSDSSVIPDYNKEKQYFTNRLQITIVLIVLAFIVILARNFYLQYNLHDEYIDRSENNRVKILYTPAKRGLILDRNNNLVAQNKVIYSLYIDIKRTENLKLLIASLKKLIDISQAEEVNFFDSLKINKDAIAIKSELSEEDLAILSVNKFKYPSIEIHKQYKRNYPYGKLFAHITGYVSPINKNEFEKRKTQGYLINEFIGKNGLEKKFEEILHGDLGYSKVEINAHGVIFRKLKVQQSVLGKNLKISIDIDLQKKAYELLSANNDNGSIVAIDTNTGEVLAMISTPSYDPNYYVNNNKKEIAKLNIKSRPLFNRAIQGIYPPASTIKPFYLIAGLDTQVITPKYTIFDKGVFLLNNGKQVFRNWYRRGHGKVDLIRAVTVSNDTYFYELANKLTVDNLNKYLDMFNIGKTFDFDIQGLNKGLNPSREWKVKKHKLPWFAGDTTNIGIGQGFLLMTPLHLAYATSIIANKGKKIRPHLVTHINGEKIPKEQFEDGKIKLRDEEIWNFATKAMVSVVHNKEGTAKKIGYTSKYTIAGKTGTGQVASLKYTEKYKKNEIPKHLRDNAFFIAFAPAENPKIALVVIIENGGSGSSYAAPMARKLMDQYLLKKI